MALDLLTSQSYWEKQLMIDAILAAHDRERAEHRLIEGIRYPVIWEPPVPEPDAEPMQPHGPHLAQRTTRHVRPGQTKRSKAVIPQVDDDPVY